MSGEMKTISWKIIASGQPAPYRDSIFKAEIHSTLHPMTVKNFCTMYLRPSSNEYASGVFNGSCGFPFGLNSYYRFRETRKGVYEYTVCEPYTD